MSALKGFKEYVSGLEALAAEIQLTPSGTAQDERTIAALDGGTSAALRRIVPILERREKGAFFTSSELARQGVEFFGGSIPDGSIFADIACGGGDLLIAIANLLPIDPDLGRTLNMWGQRLMGFDLEEQFVQAAKTRLVLKALDRGARPGATPIPEGKNLFPHIKQGNGLEQGGAVRAATHIFINPSFFRVEAPPGCTWSGAKVSAAAVFVDFCVSNAQPGTKIVAILPDVLRSGSNYKKWRRHITSRASIEAIELIGQFDAWTDVDVFLVRLRVGESETQLTAREIWSRHVEPVSTVEALFHVQVGRVVPYRDAEEGPSYPYIYPRVLPAWEEVREFTHRRQFTGATFKTPFVAVRRTSRPGHEYRAVGTIVCGAERVAVENHLIVLRPKDRLLRTCRELLEALRSARTNEWLNEYIRCRHLTVSAVRGIPW